MKKTTENGTPELGSALPPLTMKQISDSLSKDLQALIALLSFIKSHPVILDQISEVVHGIQSNEENRKNALKTPA